MAPGALRSWELREDRSGFDEERIDNLADGTVPGL